MAQSLASDSMHPSGKLPPTLTPTGHFAGKPTLPISRSVTLIGSRKQARLQLISSTVSQNHALIVNADSGPYIRDLASREHTFVNGIQVREGPLADGDEIQIGRFTFRFNESPNTQPVSAAREVAPAPSGKIDVDGSDVSIAIDGKSVLIGRRETCDLSLQEESASTTHAIVFEMDGHRYIRDLASRTGTFVNGKQIHQVELMPGDEIKIGETTMRYAAEAGAGELPAAAAAGAAADLGVGVEDLIELDSEPAAAAAKKPATAAAKPPPRAAAAPAGADALELVQDQPAETEDVELAPIDLEAHPIPAESAGEMEPVGEDELELEPLEMAPPETESQPQAVGKAEHPLDDLEIEDDSEDQAAEDLLVELDALPHEAEPQATPTAQAPADDEVALEPLEPLEVAPESETHEPPQGDELADLVVAPEEPAAAEHEVELEPLAEAPAEEEPSAVEEAPPLAGEQPVEPLAVEHVQPLDHPEEAVESELPEEAPEPAEHATAGADSNGDALALEPPEETVASAPAMPISSSRFGPGASQLDLESVSDEVEANERDVADDQEYELEHEPIGEAEPEGEAPPPKPPKPRAERAPARPVEQIIKDEAFRLPDEDEIPSFQPAAEDESAAVAELNFDTPDLEAMEKEIGIGGGRLADLAATEELPPLGDLDAATLELPTFDEPAGAAGLDFAAAEAAGVPKDVFAPISESEAEVPPLDFGAATAEAEIPPLDLGAIGDDTLSLGLDKAPPLEPPARPGRKKPAPAAEARVAPPAPAPPAPAPKLDLPTPSAPKLVSPRRKPAAAGEAPAPIFAPPPPPAPPKVKAPPAPAAPLPLRVPPTPPKAEASAPQAAAAAEALPLETPPPSAAPDVEVFAPTEATPESALDLDEAVARAPEPAAASEPPQTVELTDSSFGRAVENFVADSTTGPIVDDREGEVAVPPLHHEEPEAEIELAPVEETPAPSTPPPPHGEKAPAGQLAANEPISVVDDDGAIDLLEPAAAAEPLLPTGETGPQKPQAKKKLFDLDLAPPAEAPPPSRQPPQQREPVEVEEVVPAPSDVVEVEPVDEIEVEPVEADDHVDLQLDEEHPMVSGAAEDTVGDWGLELEAESEAKPAPPPPAPSAAPARQPAAPSPRPAPQPVADVRPPAAAPRQPTTPTPPPPAPAETYWGANQEHFLGGMPLQLGGGGGTASARPAPAPAQPPRKQGARPAPPQPPVQPIGPSTPVAPQQPQRPAARQTPQPPPRGPFAQPQQPPEQRKGTQVTTGFDGLAMGPVRETDVFGGVAGGMPPLGPANDDVFARRPTPKPSAGGGGGAAQSPPPPAAGPKRPPARRATKADATAGNAWQPPAPAPQPQDEPAELEVDADLIPPADDAGGQEAPPSAEPTPPARKKRRWFGLKSLLFLMLLCMVGAAGAIFYTDLVPNKSTVTGRLTFANFAALPDAERRNIQLEQKRILADESEMLRRDARTKLIANFRGAVSPGFLSDVIAYSRTTSAAQLDPKSGVLSVPYVGGAAAADQARMISLMRALYDQNRKRVSEANALKDTVDSLTRNRAESSKKIEALGKQIDELGSLAQNIPDPSERTKLESEAAQLESTYNTAVTTVARISDELKQLREGGGGAPAAAPGQPSSVAQPVPSNDAVLEHLQGELQQLNDRVGLVRDGRSDKAKAARQRLDDALAAFNKQIDQAQAAVKNNPDLIAYLGGAQKLLGSTRDLTDGLMKRQQEQYGQLSELKANLNDKMLARRAELWKRDKDLVKLMDLQDIKTRQYNAAVGQNLTREAEDLKTELALLDSQIRARQTKVADDGFFADAIDQLQRIIDATQKGIEDDRKRTMTALDDMQATFTRSQPALENLTPEQKQLAADMGKTLEDVSAARREYTEAAAAANKQADTEIGKLQADASALSSKVQARKKELAEATTASDKVDGAAADALPAAAPQAPVAPAPQGAAAAAATVAAPAPAIEQKTAELAVAEKARAEAQASYFAANKKLTELKNRIDQGMKAGRERDKLLAQKDAAEKEKDQFENQHELKKKLAAAAVYPLTPEEKDLVVEKKDDPRPVYTCAALGAIAALFVCMILLTGAGRGDELPEYDPQQYEQQLQSYDSANGNGNGYYAQDVFANPPQEQDAEPVEV